MTHPPGSPGDGGGGGGGSTGPGRPAVLDHDPLACPSCRDVGPWVHLPARRWWWRLIPTRRAA